MERGIWGARVWGKTLDETVGADGEGREERKESETPRRKESVGRGGLVCNYTMVWVR
jgi:hypothetical protein